MTSDARRHVATFGLIVGAVIFGVVLAGGLDLTPKGAAAPAQSPASPASSAVPVSVSTGGLPSFADLAERVLPAVVSIDAQTIEKPNDRPGERQRRYHGRGDQQDPFEFFFGPRGRPDGQNGREFRSDAGGSGFVISDDGFVVTNNHVIDGATKILVRLDGRDYEAQLKGADAATDLALLKIEAGRKLPFLPLGDSDRLRVGDYVMAVGNPLLLDHTVTVGVVSAKGRSIGLTRDASFENFIQTDAAINRGNSGGPLVNLAGEVIGIATAMNWGAENIGFAVPVSTLRAVLPQLRERGKVSRGYLGINIQNIDFDRAQAFGLPAAGGALVTSVNSEKSPAGDAGIQHGDVILRVDGREVKETRELIEYVSAQGPGKTVTLEILRDGKKLDKQVKLGERPGGEAEPVERDSDQPAGIDWMGIDYQDVTPATRGSFGLPNDAEGVVVKEVGASSPLYDEGVQPGDVVVEVNGKAIRGVVEFEREVKAARSGAFLRLYLQRFDPRSGERATSFFAIVRVP
ncbi:MAG: Do family serine endopeptidase [Thermoanaerobaculia bacterium]